MSSSSTRREFLQYSATGAAALALSPHVGNAETGGVPMRNFGKTGEKVSMLGLGGHHIGQIEDDQESIRLIREAIDAGVTFLDNAWEYHDGRSEELVGRALQDGYRERVFLMTKHHGRERKVAQQHLEDSLRRLKTDVIDLWQFHEVVYDNDPKMIFEQGAIEFAQEAKQQGKIRYIGFTGHKDPAIFKDMLSRDFPWDSVQMPVNALDPHFRSFIKEILPILTERGIAPIAMKTMASGFLLEPKVVTPEEALRFSWSQPVATLVSGMKTSEILRKNITLAQNFVPIPEAEQTALLARTREVALAGKYEPFKSSIMFDGAVGRKLHGLS